jgi:hypothetical protein
MKRLLVLVAVAFGAVALYAVTTAPAGQQAVTPAQFAALTKRVSTLEKNLKKTTSTLNAVAGCVVVTAIPVTRYDGYVAQDSAGQALTTPALDITATGETAQFWVLTTSPSCATAINSKLPASQRLFPRQLRRLHR